MIKDSLTLGFVLGVSPSWRKDFAEVWATYYQQKLGVEVKFDTDIDSLLKSCNTEYLFIQDVGHVIHDMDFLMLMESLSENIVVGHSRLTEYAQLDPTFLFFNIRLWTAAGCPAFRGAQGTGAEFKVVEGGFERTGDSTMILKQDAENGGRLIDVQVRLHGRYFDFPHLTSRYTHYFDSQTPYHEIHSETNFEETLLSDIRHTVCHADGVEIPDIENAKADVLISHGAGLSASLLATHYNVQSIVIVDKSQAALDFQRLLFSVEVPTLYGDIVATFLEQYPWVIMKGDFEADEYAVVLPFKGNVTYHRVDVVGASIERFINDFDIASHIVVNFDDIFLLPMNYYKRNQRQADGMFAQVWSMLASRTGPTRFIGTNAMGVYYKGDIINGNNTTIDAPTT